MPAKVMSRASGPATSKAASWRPSGADGVFTPESSQLPASAVPGLTASPARRSRNQERRQAVAKTAKKTTAAPAIVIPTDPEDLKGRQRNLGGSQSDHWNGVLVRQALQTLWIKGSDAEERGRQLVATVAALAGIGPKDELESMMAAQLIAAHNAAMECYRRAMIGDQTFEGRSENLNQANKLSRTFAALTDALNRHRGKGQQKVTVEHVHVHSGGQAVVGVIETPGGGGEAISRDQPHAKRVAHAPQPAMWSADEEPKLVPGASHGERPLPDARGTLTRRADR